MTLYQFNQAPHEDQLQLVFLHGTFVANRWEGNEGVSLYYLADESEALGMTTTKLKPACSSSLLPTLPTAALTSR
ncbi:MAG: hypothetical protein ACRYFX_09465 [Janthinobacterium lividum]